MEYTMQCIPELFNFILAVGSRHRSAHRKHTIINSMASVLPPYARLCAAAVSLLLGRIGRRSGREIARSALSLARSAQAERDMFLRAFRSVELRACMSVCGAAQCILRGDSQPACVRAGYVLRLSHRLHVEPAHGFYA
ncbi:hypothetical protein EVAR_4201_1 [Eumeta japonica]|uniref:Uncharacterized protein n=1 Tax=Eumeta variegata TaxID=151549 RepID=A0A4C1TGW6_EUMVA|nr:hypothetical protein EVAR_4201_1 [Eumeta japonica]